jgi:hypothetical protein
MTAMRRLRRVSTAAMREHRVLDPGLERFNADERGRLHPGRRPQRDAARWSSRRQPGC